MVETRKLDKIDRNIPKHLQADAGLTNAELAGRVNLSPTAAMRRVDKLKEDGIIRKVVALADPAKLDLTTLVIVGVVLEFEDAARKVPGCLECHLVAGEFDYFLIVRTKDLERFNKLHADEILTLPGVRQIRTFFVVKQIMSTTELPV